MNADRVRLLVISEMIATLESCIVYLLEARDDDDVDYVDYADADDNDDDDDDDDDDDTINNEDQSPW